MILRARAASRSLPPAKAATVVPLRFGADSFFPHLKAAKRHDIEPTVLKLPRIALDIDTVAGVVLLSPTP
jgi:2-phospho-L-lactate guanylyltransferase (CobY/MobA/RfbA family)